MNLEVKDWLTLVGILVTFLVAGFNLFYSINSSRKTTYINTVTTSRMKWIDSLRDKVSAFIAVTITLVNPEYPESEPKVVATLKKERDTLLHQIILHLNPDKEKDQAIVKFVEQVSALTEQGVYSEELARVIVNLRDATGAYIKKEWEKVKDEAEKGRDKKQ